MKMEARILSYIVLWAMIVFLASASDPSPLQDFCVAVNDSKTAVFVNGKFCKDPKLATANDFFYTGFNIPRNTSNPIGSVATLVTVDVFPGLNTLGIAFARVDFARSGLNPPHTHPRGVAYAAFSSQNPGRIDIANAVFGSTPPISDDVLTKAFQVDQNVIRDLQAQFGIENN
uniref:Putative germin-like protein 2-1 n=1 Tax=Davidia involucrata TaxID=16924 RepID=A0A5B7C3Q4_DAVIN